VSARDPIGVDFPTSRLADEQEDLRGLDQTETEVTRLETSSW
jgi:hypothetical protein